MPSLMKSTWNLIRSYEIPPKSPWNHIKIPKKSPWNHQITQRSPWDHHKIMNSPCNAGENPHFRAECLGAIAAGTDPIASKAGRHHPNYWNWRHLLTLMTFDICIHAIYIYINIYIYIHLSIYIYTSIYLYIYSMSIYIYGCMEMIGYCRYV